MQSSRDVLQDHYPQLRDSGGESGQWYLGLHSPQALLTAVFYLIGKKLLRALKISQAERCSDPPQYKCVENGSKPRMVL